MIRLRASKWLSILATVFVAAPAPAQTAPPSIVRPPASEICIIADEARDNLTPPERAAALLLVSHQFELEGKHVVPAGCSNSYSLTHSRLGNTIVVTLTGAAGNREGVAGGLDDLPALYSQMVRSMVTGRPMTGFNVVDRTNVTASQAAPLRVQSDSFRYVRLGYGSIFGDRGYGSSALGFGYRVELDSLAIDVSFFNFQIQPRAGTTSNGATAGSAVKLEVLRFMNPDANASAYAGGGVSYGGMSFGGSQFGNRWHGSGLQGELTVGYEFPRASSLRMFVQADATLPFYKAKIETYSRSPGQTIATQQRYASALAFSVGLGWQRNRRASQ
jgi:hypothetical protein